MKPTAIGSILLAATLALAIPAHADPATRPATAPASRPAAKAKQPDALRLATAELQREALAALQQKKAFPRESSDYFAADNDIDPAALLKVLGSRIHQNPRVDAYVKYQLLSAVKSFEGELAAPALRAYVLGSPPMIELPGVSQQDQQKWNQKARTARREDVAEINKEWSETLAPYLEANAIIIAYRDMMKSKIEIGDELRHKLLQAYLEDLSQRGAAGIEVDKQLTALQKSVAAWAHTARKAQLRDMQAALKEYTQRKPPRMLEELRWRDGEAVWTWHYAGLATTKIEKMQEEMETALANALE